MNPLTPLISIVGSGATAYITARNLRDAQTRPNMLAGLQLAESGSVPLLEALSDRAQAEGDEWLSERLKRHAQDERRHGQIFASGLRQLNKQVIDAETLRKRREAAQNTGDRQRSPFFDAYFKGYTPDDLKPDRMEWPVFFASTYILELDASKDFVRMARSLPDDPASAGLKKGILSIAKDEEGHAAYLFEAMTRRYPYPKVVGLVDEWRERKVNALVAMVTNLIRRRGEMPSMVQDRNPEPSNEATVQPVV